MWQRSRICPFISFSYFGLCFYLLKSILVCRSFCIFNNFQIKRKHTFTFTNRTKHENGVLLIQFSGFSFEFLFSSIQLAQMLIPSCLTFSILYVYGMCTSSIRKNCVEGSKWKARHFLFTFPTEIQKKSSIFLFPQNETKEKAFFHLPFVALYLQHLFALFQPSFFFCVFHVIRCCRVTEKWMTLTAFFLFFFFCVLGKLPPAALHVCHTITFGDRKHHSLSFFFFFRDNKTEKERNNQFFILWTTNANTHFTFKHVQIPKLSTKWKKRKFMQLLFHVIYVIWSVIQYIVGTYWSDWSRHLRTIVPNQFGINTQSQTKRKWN